MTSPIQMAVLDDYQEISPPIFRDVQIAFNIHINFFEDTLPLSSPTDLDALATRLHPYTIISTMRERTPFPAMLLAKLPNLRLLLTTGSRNAAIDLPACRERGVTVAGTPISEPDTSGKRHKPDTTTTHTWALILGLSRHLARDHASVRSGGWQGPSLAAPVAGKTLGLVGLGRLGTAVGRIAVMGWGMRVLVWSPHMDQGRADAQAVAAGLEVGEFEAVGKEDLFREADVVSVHMVLSEGTRGVIGAGELELMKKSALLVNTSRGPLVDEGALLEVCRRGGIGGAALDVFEREPLPQESPWRTEKWGSEGRSEVLLSPHMGYGQSDVIEGWYRGNAENLRRWMEGREVEAKL